MQTEFIVIETLNTQHIDQLENLFKKMWWAKDRTREEMLIMLETCMSFGVIETKNQKLIAYARVLTDVIKYAYIFDVITDEEYRGNGLGKMLINTIINHPKLRNVQNFELTCAPDMVAFYEKFGFSENYGWEVRPMRFHKKLS